MKAPYKVPEQPLVKDLAVVYQEPAVLGKPTPPATLAEAMELAKAIVASGSLVKPGTNPAEPLMKIQAGRELGVGPIASLNAFYMVDGKIAMSSQLMASLVNQSPNHRYKVGVSTKDNCEILWLEKIDDKWEELGWSQFTIEDAKRAGIYKPGGCMGS